MSDLWFTEIESKIFTHLKTKITKSLGRKYKELFFTTDDANAAPVKLPTVHINELTGIENAYDLRGDSVGAVLETIQISVYAKNKSECKEVLNATVLEMKRLRFEVPSMPVYISDQNIVQGIVRCRRMVGSEDALLK